MKSVTNAKSDTVRRSQNEHLAPIRIQDTRHESQRMETVKKLDQTNLSVRIAIFLQMPRWILNESMDFQLIPSMG
jgi:hypothetical protein